VIQESPTPYNAALGLAWLCGPGGHSVLRLLHERGPEEIWSASWRVLRKWGVAYDAARRFDERRAAFSLSDSVEQIARAGLRFVPSGSREYPTQFGQLALPPAGFFFHGSDAAWRRVLSVPRVTIVGTRRATAYGLRAAEAFASAFAAAGVAVISGMAFGIDTRAHKASLRPGGLTVAILGCGADVIYPRTSGWLFKQVADSGLIISELPPGSGPAPWTFPHRNRLLAALGDATLVVEGSPTSGALQTAGLALDLGRSVFAVPGSIYAEGYRGCNQLLRDGATPALDPCAAVEDFLRETRTERGPRQICGELGPATPQVGAEDWVVRRLSPRNRTVWMALAEGDSSVDALLGPTGFAARELAAALAELELEGLVARVAPGIYARAP
jgi:DNA processing protein